MDIERYYIESGVRFEELVEEEVELKRAAARWNRVKCFASRLFIEDTSARCPSCG
jgi:hypothetical protein